jgi:predicted HTH transcriptional regulator
MAVHGDLSDEEIRSQLRLGEDSRWEFKEIKFSGDKPKEPSQGSLADELAALANTAGGVMLCGVTDGGAVQGMTRAQLDAVEMVVAQACADSIKPHIRPEIRRKQLDGRPFLLVEVPEGDSLHKSPGGHYQRVGSRKQPMNSDEQLRLAQRRGQARFIGFDEQTMGGTGFATLDEALWKPLLTTRRAAPPREDLRKLDLLGEDPSGALRATVAGILLCCTDPQDWLPQAEITAAHYRGASRSSGQLDAQTITGTIAQQVEQALRFVVRNMRVASRKAPGRVDLPQYSAQAVFEALVNAVAHRDYSVRSSRIRVSMFEDRLEIASPGSLPNNLSVESMAERQATRNEVITSVLGRIPVPDALGSPDREYFLERRGDGVPIIRDTTHALSGQWPQYQLIDGSELLLTIPAARLEADPDRASVVVECDGRPLPGVDVLVLFPNKTAVRATTDTDGAAGVDLHSTHLPMTVLAGVEGYTAGRRSDWMPSEGPVTLELAPLPGGGSAVFADAAGRLPIVSGRLNPVLDSLGRSYLYADNIAVNEGVQQPVNFRLDEDLLLTDAEGREALLRVVDMVGRSVLLQYEPVERA